VPRPHRKASRGIRSCATLPYQRVIQVQDLVQPRAEQVVLSALSSLFRPHHRPRHRLDEPIESRLGQQCKLPEIAVHTDEIRQTRILAQLKNSRWIRGLRFLHGRLLNPVHSCTSLGRCSVRP